jgi:hypothetical protein
MEKESRVIAEIGTVFMYRVNLAIAVILIFINIQMVVAVLVAYDATNQDLVRSSALLALVFLYGVWAFNGMIKRFIVHSDALEYRSLFRNRIIYADEVKKVSFVRKDAKRLRITLFFDENKSKSKPVVINAAAYKDNKPLVDFCAKFDRV